MPPETFEQFYNDVLENAKGEPEVKPLKGFSKTFVLGDSPSGIEVSNKPEGKPSLVPRTLFMVLFNALSHHERLTREELEEEHNLTRVLLLMGLVSRLDYVEYDEAGDSIGFVK